MAGDRQTGRIQISAPAGALADNPEGVYRAVAAAASIDGAAPDWADRLVKAAGASRRSVPVNGSLKFRVLRDALIEQQRIYDAAMAAAVDKITEVLERAAAEATPPKGADNG